MSNSLTAGDASTTAVVSMFGDNSISDPLLDVLDVNNNQISGWASGSTGGNLRVNGNVDIQDSSTNSLFYVDAAAGRVGIGTRTPRTTLEVIGDVKGMITSAHQNTAVYTLPWIELFGQVVSSDSTDSATVNGASDRFGSAYQDSGGNYHLGTLHLDGNPLVFQTIVKSGLTAAQGKGQVVMRGYVYTPDNNLILVVGEPNPFVYSALPMTRANAWNPLACSRMYKKDIASFSLMDYRDTLSKLSKAAIVNYHYKMEPPNSKLHTGFIAEDAPIEITSSARKAVSLQNEAGFLLASLKALKIEDREFKERIERLKQWQKLGT